MAHKDINLFKAAGGERAKATKRSPVSIMLLIGLVLIVAAIGVAVYFNMKVNNAKTEYEKKETMRSNYERTISYVEETSKEYARVKNDIEAAAAINAYIERESALYPKATDTEIAAVKKTVTEDFGFSTNEPEEGVQFTATDYDGLRAALYDGTESSGTELFYYALQALAEKQKKTPRQSVWYEYYRGYFVMVFIGDSDDAGLRRLCEALYTSEGSMDGEAPFSRFTMQNDVFQNSENNYSPAAFMSKEFGDKLYNVVLLPMKSVLERAFDILEAHSRALVEENGWSAQEGLASYGVDSIVFSNEMLSFTLILPADTSFPQYMDEFSNSVFFTVSPSVLRPQGEADANGIAYQVKLEYKFMAKPDTEETEEE